jgi:hypothetical protein
VAGRGIIARTTGDGVGNGVEAAVGMVVGAGDSVGVDEIALRTETGVFGGWVMTLGGKGVGETVERSGSAFGPLQEIIKITLDSQSAGHSRFIRGWSLSCRIAESRRGVH